MTTLVTCAYKVQTTLFEDAPEKEFVVTFWESISGALVMLLRGL